MSSHSFTTVPCYVARSSIHPQGQGYFVQEPVQRGHFLLAPTNIHQVLKVNELNNLPANLQAASVEWFEDHFVVSETWDRECYINHSFTPNCHYFLGFVFTLRDLAADEEITVDYSYLLMEGFTSEFLDSTTNLPVCGLPFREKVLRSASLLTQVFRE